MDRIMEKKVALIGGYDYFNQSVRGIYDKLDGNKSFLLKGPIIEIEHGASRTIYYHVDNIEHTRGHIFDEYAHIYAWFNIENVERIHGQLEMHGAKFIEI